MPEDKLEIEEFPSNSLSTQKKKDDEPPKKAIVKQIATGKRVTKNVISTTLLNVGNYILVEILIPAAKNTISDMINNATDMVLFGEPKSRRRDRDRDKFGRVSYDRMYDRDRDSMYDRERRDRIYGRSRFNSDEILLATREDAEGVLQGMFDVIDQYNSVSVSDFLELVGLPDEYTDRNYGWVNLRDAQVRRIRDGYIIELPNPRPLAR